MCIRDRLSIGTAGEVSSAYKFDLPISMCAAFFLMLTVFAVEHKIRFVRYTGKQRIGWFCVLAVLTARGFGYLPVSYTHLAAGDSIQETDRREESRI